MLEVHNPLANKVSRKFLSTESETKHIGYLSSKDSKCYTTCETYNDRIWYELDYRSKFKYSKKYKKYSGHDCCNSKACNARLLDNSIDNYNKGSGRTTYLYFTSSQWREYQTSNNSCDNAFFRRYS